MDRPTLRQLEALDMIAREGSFRAAARTLGVSQVAISDHIKQLEARLGASLFDRARGGKASITEAGRIALARARIILADCDALIMAMSDLALAGGASSALLTQPGLDVEAVPLRQMADRAQVQPIAQPSISPADPSTANPASIFAAHPAPSTPMQARGRADQPVIIGSHPSILARFQAKIAAFEEAVPYRPVSIDYNCYVADRVALALSENRITLAYFYALGATRIFPSDYLWSERWSLYVGREHPLAGQDFVGRDDLLSLPLLTYSATNRLRPLVDSCLEGAGLGTMPVVLETDDYGQLAERAREGEGVLPLFGAAAARIGSSSGLKRLPFVDPIAAIEVRRVVHPDAEHDDEVQALVATLQ